MFPELTTGWLGMWGLQRLSKEKHSSKIMALPFCVQHAHSLHFWMRPFLTREIPFLSRNVWEVPISVLLLCPVFCWHAELPCVTKEERVKNVVPLAAWHKVDFFFSLPKRTNDGWFLCTTTYEYINRTVRTFFCSDQQSKQIRYPSVQILHSECPGFKYSCLLIFLYFNICS